MDETRRDLLYAARLLRRSPGFTAITVLTLALGIGANVAVFSLINAIVLRPLPVRHPENLVELLFKAPGDPRLNSYWWMDYEHLRGENHVFSNLMAVSLDRRQVSHDARPGRRGVHVRGWRFLRCPWHPAGDRTADRSGERAGGNA
jgi:putative ABC transport system permease protein